MGQVRVIEIHENITAANDQAADLIREKMTRQGTFFVNVMSAPGSGKTTTLVALINLLKNRYAIGEMDVDIKSSLDAQKVADAAGVPSIQIHNGGLCHIDADMTARALAEYDTTGLDILFLENIGNMVCPAEFDTGAHKNLMLFSITEGHDKPLKYPVMFQESDVVLINKIDALDYFDFDMDKAEEYILARNPAAKIIPISAKTGEGLSDVAAWIEEQVREIKAAADKLR
ncbi:MAG: hydrogenase nickel incorporation protein HypB [Eubacterium sp.]|nr:hydrogenase nickel incorporation protein HypB [Eubacterium sp.]